MGIRANLRHFREDVSASAIVSGFIVVLVGMTSSAILVFQAATAAGMDAASSSSWLGALCLGMGLLTVVFSLAYRSPVLLAWSTAGSALLVTGVEGLALSEIIGAFIFSAFLIFLSGVTGLFERIMDRIPLSIANALLAGVLVHFSIDAFGAFKSRPLLIGSMFAAYLVARKFFPRWTMLAVLVFGTLVAALSGQLQFTDVAVSATHWEAVRPTFSGAALVGIGIPLFVVTMASQNLTGITVMRANGFHVPFSRVLGWSGAMNAAVAPLGGFALNFAAITAAISMGPESHPLPRKRYVAAVAAGVLYILIGLFAGTVTSLFSAFPAEMIAGIAGFALLATVANALQSSLAREENREAAYITFAVAASGISLFGVGAAFWAVVVGGLVHFVLAGRR